MKKTNFHTLCAAVVLACVANAGLAAALVNPGFDAGLSGWSTSGDVSADATDVHSGALSARLADDAAALTATLADAVDVSSITGFGFWGRSDAGLLNLVVLDYSDGTNSGTDVSIFDLGNTDWTYYDLGASLAAGKALAGFTIYGSSAAASFIDDVTLTTTAATTVPEPALPALLFAGMGGLAWQRSRRR